MYLLRLSCCLAGLWLGMLWASRLAAVECLIFLPEAPSMLQLQQALDEDPALAGIDCRVVGKARSLQKRLADSDDLSLAIAPANLLSGHDSLRPHYQGLIDEQARRPWHLVCLGRPVDDWPNVPQVLGCLDLGGRAAIGRLLRQGFDEPPTIRRIRLTTKREDVVRLLGLELAQIALLTDGQYRLAHQQHGDKLHRIRSSKPLALPQVAVHQSLAASTAAPFAQLQPATLGAMGLTGLRTIPEAEDRP